MRSSVRHNRRYRLRTRPPQRWVQRTPASRAQVRTARRVGTPATESAIHRFETSWQRRPAIKGRLARHIRTGWNRRRSARVTCPQMSSRPGSIESMGAETETMHKNCVNTRAELVSRRRGEGRIKEGNNRKEKNHDKQTEVQPFSVKRKPKQNHKKEENKHGRMETGTTTHLSEENFCEPKPRTEPSTPAAPKSHSPLRPTDGESNSWIKTRRRPS